MLKSVSEKFEDTKAEYKIATLATDPWLHRHKPFFCFKLIILLCSKQIFCQEIHASKVTKKKVFNFISILYRE